MNPVGYLETGVLHCDDNLAALSKFPSECIDLIYLDPPFFSNRFYEVIWGDEAEKRSFEDRWEGGIEVYLEWMEARLRHIHRLLRPTGSLYLHCDQSASHYLKVMLDGIFGRANFRSDIVWKRKAGRGETNSAAVRFGVTHDNLLFYGRSADTYLKRQYRPSNPEYIAAKFTHVDEDGRRYRRDNLTSPSLRPNLVYEYKGYSPPPKGWAVSLERMKEMDAEGRLYFPARKTQRIQRKRYLDELEGETVDSLWDDIPPINSQAAERLGYPTQKPEALLARIIDASCPPGGIVLDPFCGCGTTVAVAHQLQRQWIGVDISPTAIEIVKRRLNKLGAAPVVYGLPKSLNELRQLGPHDFQTWVIERVNGHRQTRKTGDMGVDGYEFFERLPIQVKQSEHVGRNVVDNFEAAIEREGKHKGYIVAFSFTRGAVEEAARVRRQGKMEIVLVKAEDVLRVGELIDAAAREGRPPHLSGQTPDLIGLFRELREVAEDRTGPGPSKRTEKRGPAQQQFPGVVEPES